MLNCVMATRRPRIRAGEISAIYMGDTTEAPPTAGRQEPEGHEDTSPQASAHTMADGEKQDGEEEQDLASSSLSPACPLRSIRRSCRLARWLR